MIPTEKNMQPQEVSDLDIAFGGAGNFARLMPDRRTLDTFKPQPWSRDLFMTLLYRGGSMAHLEPKPGIDRTKALRHIKTVLGSFEPKHEDKETAVAYFFETWFTNTRIIGPTKSEFQALDRGAHALLGVPSDGMEPIHDGQEVLAVEGWLPGEEPRPDVRRLRLLISGEPFEVTRDKLTPEQIEKLTGYSVADSLHAARLRLDQLIEDIDNEIGGMPSEGPWLFIPFRRVPM